MGVHPVGTDGTVLYYQPEELMEQFRRSQEKVNRIYLHSLLHCIFLHCFPEKDEEGNPAVDVQYWNLACDITVENIIDGLYLKCVHQPASMVKKADVEADTGRGKGNDGSREFTEGFRLFICRKIKCRSCAVSLLRMTMVSGMKTIQTVLRCPSGKRTGTTSATACRQRWKLFQKKREKAGETLVDQLRAQNKIRYDL